jgi:hypothetical protein
VRFVSLDFAAFRLLRKKKRPHRPSKIDRMANAIIIGMHGIS